MAEPSRIAALDVLRGIAILGTFASNAWVFAYPGGPAALFLNGIDAGGAVETGLRALSNGKFLALLTLLFGVGLELQYRSAVRRGTPWPGRYPVRAAILFLEGLVHYVLVFEFDVLTGYAITSLLVAHLIGRSERVVQVWIWGVGTVYAALVVLATAALVLAPDGAALPPAGYVAPPSWTGQVAARIEMFALFRVELLLIVPSAVVLFLVGSRLVRAGTFDADGTRIRGRLVAFGLGLGVPLNVASTLAGADWFLVDRYLVPPLVALGLLGLVTEIVLRTRGGVVRRGLAAVGRTALSCYVGQNVLASVLCLGWGVGLATRLDGPWWVVGLWAGVSITCVLAASAWLRHHERGPLELLAHRMYGRATARSG